MTETSWREFNSRDVAESVAYWETPCTERGVVTDALELVSGPLRRQATSVRQGFYLFRGINQAAFFVHSVKV